MQLVRVKNCYDNGVIKFVLGSIVKLSGLDHCATLFESVTVCATAMSTIHDLRAR